jgi:hypothetical protein
MDGIPLVGGTDKVHPASVINHLDVQLSSEFSSPSVTTFWSARAHEREIIAGFGCHFYEYT